MELLKLPLSIPECGSIPSLLPPEKGLVVHVGGRVVRHGGVCRQVGKILNKSQEIKNYFEIGDLVKWISHGCAGLKGSSSEGRRVAPPAKDSGLW